MGNDKPICGSAQHEKQAEAVRDSHRGVVDWFMDELGFPKEDADKSKVACIPREVDEASRRPKLNAREEKAVAEQVPKLEAAVKSGDLTSLGKLFSGLAPRADNTMKADAFEQNSRVRVADETIYRLNKDLHKHGIDLDYRPMGVVSGDRSPSLIVSRETQLNKSTTEHLEVTLQGGDMPDFIKHSAADRVLIRDFPGPDGKQTDYSHQRLEPSHGKTAAEVTYQQIMKPYFDSKK